MFKSGEFHIKEITFSIPLEIVQDLAASPQTHKAIISENAALQNRVCTTVTEGLVAM